MSGNATPESTPTPEPRPRVQVVADDNGGLVARLASQRSSFKTALKASRTENARLKRDLEAARGEAAELRSKADPAAQNQRAEQLAQELRTIKHRGRFDAIARELEVKPEALEDLYQLSGYKPEADAPDDAAIRSLIEGQKAAKAYLFGPASPATTAPATPTPATPPPPERKPAGPGNGRGGAPDAPPAGYTEAQLSDPAFVMDNFAAIAASAKESRARGFSR